ncbi:uncharacterized protein LOC129697688 [Leucoraja erinacea]|uniref:uncharacterized protein LOC129697688 n=1 Tax=Leucoraja erinaceus TaxID=7782 RepID=UPI002455D50C|nr:uncharacterized protein LOC129697688 [Leucoraja erinacea]
MLLRQWTHVTSLSLAKVTMKVVMPMALVSAQRVQTLQKLRLDRMEVAADAITFYIYELVKQSRPGVTVFKIIFTAYPTDSRLCVMSHLLYYIKTTRSLRGVESALFISHKKPHKKVSVQTNSRWLKQVLLYAGIDTDNLKSPSTRAASMSAARPMDVPIDYILAAAEWSSFEFRAQTADPAGGVKSDWVHPTVTRAEPKMLRLCLTLSVLLGLQVAGTGADHSVGEACKNSICLPLKKLIKYDTYEELYLPELRWLSTFVKGADLNTAIDIAISRFFKYSRFNNSADTVVPLSIPWSVYVPLTFEIPTSGFLVSISLPAGIVDPPAPNDPSVQLLQSPEVQSYVRTFTEKTEDYDQLIDEFKRDLEKDNRSFNNTGVYINWYNINGLMQIVIKK